MGDLMLVRALRLFLKGKLGAKYPTPGGTFSAPKIIDGFLPPKRDAKDDFPFVLLLPFKGETSDEGTQTEVSIKVGAWSEDYDGYGVALALMADIREALLSLPDRVLDDRFRLAMPLTWDLDDDQPYPGWMVSMGTIWETPAPEVELSNGAKAYGYFEE